MLRAARSERSREDDDVQDDHGRRVLVPGRGAARRAAVSPAPPGRGGGAGAMGGRHPGGGEGRGREEGGGEGPWGRRSHPEVQRCKTARRESNCPSEGDP